LQRDKVKQWTAYHQMTKACSRRSSEEQKLVLLGTIAVNADNRGRDYIVANLPHGKNTRQALKIISRTFKYAIDLATPPANAFEKFVKSYFEVR